MSIEFLKRLKFLVKPKFWFMLENYSKPLDELIIKAIEDQRVIVDGSYCCKIGELRLWIGNYPYSFGSVEKLRPSRSTIIKLKNHLTSIGWVSGDQEIVNYILKQGSMR